MNELLEVLLDLIEVRPQPFLDIQSVAIQSGAEFGVLLACQLPEILFEQRDPMLEGSLNLGNGAKRTDLRFGAPLLEAYPPFGPMLANVVGLLHLGLVRRELLIDMLT